MRPLLPALVAGLALLTVPSPAAATEASRAETLELAHEATFDDGARRRLLGIDEIDGRPVHLGRLLAGARGEEIERRVVILLQTRSGSPPAGRDPAAERAEAESVLAQDRYQPDEIPRPFRGPLEWIAQRLEPIGNAIDTAYRWIVDVFGAVTSRIPGGAATLWTLLGLLVVVAVVAQTKKIVERRARTKDAPETEVGTGTRSDDPRDLEKRAAAARAAGDHELAVRLLFRAGLLRLARARVIPARRSLTTGEIRRLLGSPDFDRIGTSFDEIAYGRRPASESDADSARTGWSNILQKTSG